MRNVAANCSSAAVSFDRRLSGHGSSFFVTMQPDGGCSFTFRFNTLPPSKAAASIAALIQQRFASDERFREDLLAHLAAKGRLFRRAADPIPDQPLAENWTSLGDAAGSVAGKLAERLGRAPASPPLASNR